MCGRFMAISTLWGHHCANVKVAGKKSLPIESFFLITKIFSKKFFLQMFTISYKTHILFEAN